VQRIVDFAERDMSRFAIVKTTILTNNRGGHIHFLRTGQRNAVFEKVASFLVRIEGDAHDVFVPPETIYVNRSGIEQMIQ